MKDLNPDSQFLVQDLYLGPPYTKWCHLNHKVC